jgi:catechol 2,3-dioxygenase-like lactoylglutathione lyase family enzyme
MSLNIGKMFHIVHVSEALRPLDSWYDDVFVPRRGIMDNNYSAHEMRDGSLLAIGDTTIETMAPAQGPGSDMMPVGKFFARFGRHLHSLAWYTDDVGAVWEHLVDQGIRVIHHGPNDRPDEGDIYTHPKDTLTQLEFFQPPAATGRIPDPRFDPTWPEQWAASTNPLGVQRLAYATVVGHDMERAKSIYVDVLGGTIIDEGCSAMTGTVSTYVAIGPETVVELAVPTDAGSLAGRDLSALGESCHAVAFTVADLDQVAAHLDAKGIAILAQDDTMIMADPADTYGAPFRFTTRVVPGDPRDRPT